MGRAGAKAAARGLEPARIAFGGAIEVAVRGGESVGARGVIMSAKPQQFGPPNVGTSTIPMGLRILAIALRTLEGPPLACITIRAIMNLWLR